MVLLMVFCIPFFFAAGVALALGGGKLLWVASVVVGLWFALSYLWSISWLRSILNASRLMETDSIEDLGWAGDRVYCFENPRKIALKVKSRWLGTHWFISKGFLMGFSKGNQVQWNENPNGLTRPRLWLALHYALWTRALNLRLRSKAGRLDYLLQVAKEQVL